MRSVKFCIASSIAIACYSCSPENKLGVTGYETNAAGKKLAPIIASAATSAISVSVDTQHVFQRITGFGGAITEASAKLLMQAPLATRNAILDLYFNESGANYTMSRTHINSCDFSLHPYAYDTVPGDTFLTNFTLNEDQDDIIPVIQAAQARVGDQFKLIASPWTAPPWMKDNNHWFGGKLLPAYYKTWALYFDKYATALDRLGIPLWAFTIENEPIGNDAHWESMHFTPREMTAFTRDFLIPQLQHQHPDIKLFVYDQNRGEELEEWAKVLLSDTALKEGIAGTAVHWYNSTVTHFPASLQYTHSLAPEKSILQTEACIDAEVPHWKDDAWYWSKKATDWGYDWAAPDQKHLHPKYIPTERYVTDIIGCLNNWVKGWVDWNILLNRQGGPNHVENWCIAPIIIDEQSHEYYVTPLYYVMSHFSKYILPGAKRVKASVNSDSIQCTAAKNPDGSTALVIYNPQSKPTTYTVHLGEHSFTFELSAQAIQTIIIG